MKDEAPNNCQGMTSRSHSSALRPLFAVVLAAGLWGGTAHADVLHAEDFDDSSGGYTVTGTSSWQWGEPQTSPATAQSPLSCWGTNLEGDYDNNELGALVSPVIAADTGVGKILLLSWWEWSSYEGGYDRLFVQATRDGGGTWETVALPYPDGTRWQLRRILLDERFATSTLRIRFFVQTDGDATQPGWSVDNIEIESVMPDILLATDLEEGSEPPSELSLQGAWELGMPAGDVGPASAHSGARCLATNLDGFYGRNEVSDCGFTVAVPVAADGVQTLGITWWQFLQLDGVGDELSLAVSFDGGLSWQSLYSASRQFIPAEWVRQDVVVDHNFSFDPDAPEQDVLVRLRLSSDDAFENTGAYIDNIAVMVLPEGSNDSPPHFVPDADEITLRGVVDENDPHSEQPFTLQLEASDPDGDALDWSILRQPSYGSATVTPDGNTAEVTYTPPTNWEGETAFHVQVGTPSGLFDTLKVTARIELGQVDTTPPEPVHPGDLDPRLACTGFVMNDSGVDETATDLALQPDGKLITVGTASDGIATSIQVRRFTDDGQLDPDFGISGLVALPARNDHDEALAVALQQDGGILVAGRSRSSARGGDFDVLAIRLEADGSVDATFGDGGFTTIDVAGGDDAVRDIAVQTDGAVVLAGNSHNGLGCDALLVRLETDGSLDTSFGNGGIQTFAIGPFDDRLAGVVIQDNGFIVAAGFSWSATDADFVVLRTDATGQLDAAFGTDGVVILPIGPGDDTATALTLRPDGGILVGGATTVSDTDTDLALAAFLPDGGLDAGFGSDGIQTVDIAGASRDELHTLALQPDGRILVAGNTSLDGETAVVVARHETNGSLDTDYGIDGVQLLHLGADGHPESANAILVDSHLRAVVAGYAHNGSGSDSDSVLARLLFSAWEVRGAHGAAGELWTPVPSGYVEPRDAGISALRIRFRKALSADCADPAFLSVRDQTTQTHSVEEATLDSTGRVLAFTLDAVLPDREQFTATLQAGLTDRFGNATDTAHLHTFHTRKGDVNGSGSVNAIDLLTVRAQQADTVTPATAPYDINGNGTINVIDMLRIRTHSEP